MVHAYEILWGTNWREQVTARVKEDGHDSISTMLKEDSRALQQICEDLGNAFAPRQLMILQLEEAATADREQVLRDWLVRKIKHSLPQGWSSGADSESGQLGCIGGWLSDIELVAKMPQLSRKLQGVLRIMRETITDPYWLPQNSDDPVLIRIYNQALNESSQS